MTTVYGNINADGSIERGTGFVAKNTSKGFYLITFNQDSFGNTPTVILTQNPSGWDSFDSSGGDTRDNCVVLAVDETSFKVKTGDGDGKASNRNFMFIAIGT